MQNLSNESLRTQDYRLDVNVKPESYDIYLKPNLLDAKFLGKVLIKVNIAEPTKTITLNGAELKVVAAFVTNNASESLSTFEGIALDDINSEELGSKPSSSLEWISSSLDEELERITLTATKDYNGETYLGIVFEGILNDKLRGFYRSTFIDGDENEQVIATTHFEATDARRAFPCFDEPQLKATFKVTLEVDGDLMAISNWPIEKQTETSVGTRLVEFQKTMKMSTYLVAFVVGNLESSREVDVDGIPLRVIHVPGKGSMTEFALQAGEHSLKFFSEYFKIPYPGKKLDLIALPDFAFGAMENLGAVTFRETALLANPENASRADLERVADVVAHEIAHMWFGDLVTMKWWNGIWLNEAFATFMEMLAVDSFKPEWDRWVTFGLSREAAMGVDSLSTTRPIEFEVFHPREAEAMFDVLTYQKGAAVLRMLEQFIGPEVFKDGIRDYLQTHKYSNTETSDLWDALEAATKRHPLPNGIIESFSVRKMMDTWIFQGGYPLISVKKTDSKSYEISQNSFYYETKGAIGSNWMVPLVVKPIASKEQSLINLHLALSSESSDVELGESESLSANGNGYGFYRTSYSNEIFENLLNNWSALSTLEQFNLVSDSWSNTIREKSDLDEFLKIAKLIRDSKTYDINMWAIVSSAINSLYKASAGTFDDQISQTCNKLFEPVINNIGIDQGINEPENRKSFRSLIYRTLGVTGKNDRIRNDALEKFDLMINQDKWPDPDLVGAVLDVVADVNRTEDYESVYHGYQNPKSPQDEMRFLNAMSSFCDKALIQRTLNMTMDEIRTQNAPFIIQSMLFDKNTQGATLDFMQENFSLMFERYPSPTIPRMLDGIRGLTSIDSDSKSLYLDKVDHFLAEHPVEASNLTVRQARERLEIAVKFNIRIRESLKQIDETI